MTAEETSPPNRDDDTKDKGDLQGHFWGVLAALFCLSIVGGVYLATLGDEPLIPPRADAGAPQPKRLGKPVRVGLIRGQVLTSGRKPLRGATARITRLGRSKGDNKVMTIETDLDGRFTLGPVARLGHRLEIEADGHAPQTIERLMPGADPLTIELIPGNGLYGRATFNGEPIAGASVHIASPGVWPQQNTTTGPDGLFTTKPLPEGDYEIMIRASTSKGALGLITTLQHSGSTPPTPYSFVLAPATTLKLLVEDADTKAPISGALVTVAEDLVHILSVSAWTDDQGSVTIAGLPRQPYTLTIAGPGYLQASPALDLSDATPIMDMIASLKPASALRGVVTNLVDTPLELVQLTAHVKTSDGQQWLVSRDPTFNVGLGGLPEPGGGFQSGFGFFSDEAGRFEIVGLPPGEVYIEARKEGFDTAVVGPFVLGRAAALDDIKVRLSPGHRIKGRVIGPESQAIAGAQVKIVPAEEPSAAKGPLPGVWALRHRHLITDEEGRFEAEDLPARVSITAKAEGYEETSRTLALEGESASEIEVVLGALSDAIKGRVVLEGELPVANVKVWHLPPPGKQARRADVCVDTTDEDGRFALEGCPEGDFWVELLPTEDTNANRGFAKLSPDQDAELTLHAPTEITISVRDDSDTPIENAEVGFRRLKGDSTLPPWLLKKLTVTQRTDEAGLLSIDTLTRGQHTLRITHKGHRPHTQPLMLAQDPQRIDATLKEARLVRGGVADRYGAPVPKARIRITSTQSPDKRHIEILTDDRGRFEITLEDTGPMLLDAAHAEIGHGQSTLPEGTEPIEDLIIELDEPTLDIEEWSEPLAAHGIHLWQDGDKIVLESIDEGSQAADKGLKRGDLTLSARRESNTIHLEITRSGKLIEITLR